MKALIWIICGVLFAVWSGFVALSASLVGWLLSAVADGQIGSAAQALGQWPLPAWVGIWVDPALIESLQAQWLVAVSWLGEALPSAGALTGWVVPLMWGVWAVVSVCLLAAGTVGHLMVRQRA